MLPEILHLMGEALPYFDEWAQENLQQLLEGRPDSQQS